MKNINEEDDTLKIGYLKEHVLPLNANEQLGAKNYQDLLK
jgi:DNA recombination protein RmuC